jgi:hypothetical protein
MTINFPNPSRSYDAKRRYVCFWGYDQVIEVSFFVEEDALCRISPGTNRNEAGLLNAFDVHRERILRVAGEVHSKRGKISHFLKESDF